MTVFSRRILWIAVSAAGGISLLLLVVFAYGVLQADASRIVPGVSAFGIRLDGSTHAQAEATLQRAVSQTLQPGWHFRLENTDLPVADPNPFIRYDLETTLNQAFALGHSSSLWKNVLTHLRLRVYPHQLTAAVTLDRKGVETWLRSQLKDLLVSSENAQLDVSISPKNEVTTQIRPERVGLVVDLEPALDQLQNQATALDFEPIALNVTRIEPNRTAKDLEPLIPDVPQWLAHAPFKVTAEDQMWTITSSTLAGWLNATSSGKGFTIGLDPERLKNSLNELTSHVLQEPQNGKLVLENDALKEFVAPAEGVAIDLDATVASIERAWRNGSSTIPLFLVHKTPLIPGPDAERLGIREVIGVGRSNFAGSPVNRRKNIALGAKKMNGVLIAPDEEFSLLKTLGEVDGAHGWLQELVIKKDKTIPEYGGGLCQIGTTTFRAALGSGLPVTQRQNHSYRVPYYEPAGTDATIYDPWPDLRFKNDTGHWILTTTLIQGNDLTFTFWGTEDGRLANQTKPKVFNVVPPPPKQIIETLSLPVGQTKCTERAHAGADAAFEYTVTYPSGETKKVTFSSHYKPWGAVCLVGVTQLTASSTAMVDETGINNPN